MGAERSVGGERLQPVLARDLDDLGVGAGALMDEHGLAGGDGERVGSDGLDAPLEGAGLDGNLDVGLDPGLERGEERVLLVDGERQQAVEELRHRRQVLLEVAFPGELEPGGLLEVGERPALDVTAPERDVELAQGRLGVGALQVVAGPEERGVVAAHGSLRVALAPCDGAERVEPPRDGGDEPALALHVGGDGAEQRCRGLVRAVGPAQPLDCLVGPPSGLQQVVDAALGVGAAEIGVIAAPDAARHREHQDSFRVVHEGGGLGEVGGGGPRAECEALALRIGDLQHAARTAGDLGHGVMAEAVDDLIQRRLHRRQ